MALDALVALAEPLAYFFMGVVEVFARLLRPGIRSIRYAYSSTYRQKFLTELGERSTLYRTVYLTWGYFAAALWLAALAWISYEIISYAFEDKPCDRLDLDHAVKCAKEIKDVLSR